MSARQAHLLRVFGFPFMSLVIIGLGIGQLLHLFLPGLPVQVPFLYLILALVVSVLAGLISGVAPANRASKLNPLEALRAE